MNRKNNIYFRAIVLLFLFSVAIPYSSAVDYSSGYNRFRPLDQEKGGFRQQPTPQSFRSEKSAPVIRPGNNFGYQSGAAPSPQMGSPYKFRELPAQTETKTRAPKFRPDPRLNGKGASTSESRPKRWTGNDVIAPPSADYPAANPYPNGYGWQQSPGYSYAPGVLPPPVPQYYPQGGRNYFPWPGFMPSFSW